VPFIDGDNTAIPGALPAGAEEGEAADPDAAAEAREQAEAEAVAVRAAEAAPKEKPYTLKVDGNQFSVSGEELLAMPK
jgi:hypothetical protein